MRIDYVVRRHHSCAVSIDRFITDKFNTRYEFDDLNVNAGLPLGEDRFVQPIKVPGGQARTGKVSNVVNLQLQPAAEADPDRGRHARHQFIVK